MTGWRSCDRDVGSEHDPRRKLAERRRNAMRIDRARRLIVSEYEGEMTDDIKQAVALLTGAVHELWEGK